MHVHHTISHTLRVLRAPILDGSRRLRVAFLLRYGIRRPPKLIDLGDIGASSQQHLDNVGISIASLGMHIAYQRAAV